jgi:DNA-binding transcriptional regulator GbsR (MarR family)
MTEHKPKLPPAVERFVLHWGEMGAIWGTNRSVGQIHALLYLSDKPLTAEDIADTLGLARSNVSNSLKELAGWSLIRREHVMGDRRDYFAAETDLWEMVRRIAEGRKAREIDPTLEMLRACLREANDDRFISETVRDRVAAMHDFVAMLDTWAADMRRVPRAKLAMLMRLGAAVVRYLPGRMPAGTGAGGGDAPGVSGKGYDSETIESVEESSKPP